jgi:hypothetical protein
LAVGAFFVCFQTRLLWLVLAPVFPLGIADSADVFAGSQQQEIVSSALPCLTF